MTAGPSDRDGVVPVLSVIRQVFVDGIEGAVDRYVAMTRATQQLVILTSS